MTQYTATKRSDPGRDIFKTTSKKSKVKETTKEAAMAIRVGAYGRYQVKSGRIAGAYIARAFPQPPTNARGVIAEASGETEEAAIAALHAALDAREADRSDERRADPNTGTLIPSAEEYAEALNSIALTRPQRAMLIALSLAETDGLAEAKVADAGSYRSLASASKALAGVGRMIAGYLSAEAGSEPDKSSDGTALIGYQSASGQDEKPGNWIVHPELGAAIRNAA